MAKITRVIHIRPPLKVKTTIPGIRVTKKVMMGEQQMITSYVREQTVTEFIPDRLSPTGGATVLITGVPGESKVEIQVTFCRPDEMYSRKGGRLNATQKEKYVVDVTDIPKELLDIDHQMLIQFSKRLQKNGRLRSSLTKGGGYAYAMYWFLPKPEVTA